MNNVITFETRQNKAERIESEILAAKISKIERFIVRIDKLVEELKSIEGMQQPKIYLVKE